MTERKIAVHIGTLDDMGRRFVEAWKEAEAGREVAGEHVTFLGFDSFLAALSPKRIELIRHVRKVGPCSIRRLSQELGRDYKSVHGEVMRLIDAGLIERGPSGEVAVQWDRLVTELDLAA
jgi:predicted transcriptional regulator